MGFGTLDQETTHTFEHGAGRSQAGSDIYARLVTLTGVGWIGMDYSPAASTTDARSAIPSTCTATSGPYLIPPVTIAGLLACELALARFGLLRHNSLATWRQLPQWCRCGRRNLSSYLSPGVYERVHLASQTELDRISAQSGDRSSVGRISHGIMHVFRTLHRHAGILNNVASRRVPFDSASSWSPGVDASGTAARAVPDIVGT